MFKSASLTPAILHVVKDKGTELEASGLYDQFGEPGTYLCRQCGLALFRSHHKFAASCGWPSFDEQIADAIKGEVEIVCARCGAHLGHTFRGENYTEKNIRHCVNSLALDHVNDLHVMDSEEAFFAGGCFWGIEYYFQLQPGVLKTEVGYLGGEKTQPTDREVAEGETGHIEAVRVLYDPTKTDFEKLAKLFFEIHNFAPIDAGLTRPLRYQSAIFYYTPLQLESAKNLIARLENLGHVVTTKLLPVSVFWPADAFNQQYFQKRNKAADCHRYEKKFFDE